MAQSDEDDLKELIKSVLNRTKDLPTQARKEAIPVDDRPVVPIGSLGYEIPPNAKLFFGRPPMSPNPSSSNSQALDEYILGLAVLISASVEAGMDDPVETIQALFRESNATNAIDKLLITQIFSIGVKIADEDNRARKSLDPEISQKHADNAFKLRDQFLRYYVVLKTGLQGTRTRDTQQGEEGDPFHAADGIQAIANDIRAQLFTVPPEIGEERKADASGPPSEPLGAPRCSAVTRQGKPCRQPCVRDGEGGYAPYCRMHTPEK